MTSQAQALAALPGVRGRVFRLPVAPGEASLSERAKHLADVDVPMLFIQGYAGRTCGARVASICLRSTRIALHSPGYRGCGSRVPCAR